MQPLEEKTLFDNQKLLVVVDPTEDDLSTLDRVLTICKTRVDETGKYPEVTLFVSAEIGKYPGEEDGYRELDWITNLRKPFVDLGVNCKLLLSWTDNWAKSILEMASGNGFTSIVMPYHSGDERQNLSNAFWYLVRNTRVPVILTGTTEPTELRKTILVCRNVQEPGLKEINKKTLGYAKDVAEKNGGTVHLVSSYQDSSDYPDRGRLAADTGLPNNQLHVKLGAPEKVISEVAKEIDADLVLLAVSRRTGIKTALMGRNMDRIIKSIDRDMLLVV